MIKSKYLTKITIMLVCLSLFVCTGIVYFAGESAEKKVTEYENKLFGDDILSIDIRVDEDEWQSMLDNATAKEYISGDIVINGVTFSTVGIRTKGNSSLSQVDRMEDSDRYSLQFKSDYYIKGQTFYGLDDFCINNLIGDTTYMKDYISYDIMEYIGVETPLKNYANVTVNGEDFGFYLALERYDKSFLDRVYNTSGGQLYNVKIEMGQRDNFINNQAEEIQGGPGRGGMGGGGGGSLVYIDDSIDSYSAIFNNAVFNKNSDKDKQRVITAIKNLNEGKNLEQYFDVDEILRYFAAHTVVVNLDSYSSNMAQNYYIYENDGKIRILPWDYNFAFGGFQSGSATDVVNFSIDTPVSGTSMEERPLLNKLFEVEEYKEKYYKYLQQIVDGYFMSGVFRETVLDIDAKINSYVKNDVTSFTTYEKYELSLPIFIELGNLRAQSIEGQLDGANLLIDASHINLSDLGSMMGGGEFGDRRGNEQVFAPNAMGGNMMDMDLMQEAMNIFQENNRVLTDEVRELLLSIGLTEEQIEQLENMNNQMPGGGFGRLEEKDPSRQGDIRNNQVGFPNNQGSTIPFDPTYVAMTIVSLLILAVAFIFVFRAKKTY